MAQTRTPRRIEGIKGDECNCGRRATVIHCTKCGSVRIYSRMNRVHKMMNGEQKLVENQYRCQTCGNLFIDEEREFCEAPPFTTELAKLKAKALAEASRAGISPEVILEAQRRAGHYPDKDAQQMADTEQEGTVDWSVTDEDVKEIIAVRDVAAKEADALQKASATGKPVEEVKKPWSHAEYTFRKEWVDRVAAGQRAVLPPVAEYVERRMKGELFDNVE